MKKPSSPGGCCGGLDRRELLAGVAAAAGALSSGALAAGAQRWEARLASLAEARARLCDPRRRAELSSRGAPTWLAGEELRFVGMPVGGLCAGQVYLAGDGRLWLWDVENRVTNGLLGLGNRGATYVEPLEPTSPFAQGFALTVEAGGQTTTVPLDARGFPEVRFRGEYPIGTVRYGEVRHGSGSGPVEVELEAFSPFEPLDVEASSFPATLLRWRLRNRGAGPARVRVTGHFENAVGLDADGGEPLLLTNRIVQEPWGAALVLEGRPAPEPDPADAREEILFDDFERERWEPWVAEGTAFGAGPVVASEMPAYQGEVDAHGERLVNSHHTRAGEDVRSADRHTGTLTSPPFRIERGFIQMRLGGGRHPGRTGVELLVDGEVVRSLTGRNENRLRWARMDVRELEGREARLRVIDREPGPWGNVGVDEIVFTDRPHPVGPPVTERSDFGSFALGVAAPAATAGAARVDRDSDAVALAAALREGVRPVEAEGTPGDRPVGALAGALELGPGESGEIVFAVAWHFPNLRLPGFSGIVGRHYATRFDSAEDVVREVLARAEELTERTRAWRDTWYDSTLPYWLLDRTFANASTLATSTCHRFADGRFYGWEGVGCCYGTCTHVWHYAQSVGRLFPELERDLRERVDFGLAFDPKTGAIGHRGELAREAAHDGQEGSILRALREHQMSADDGFLRRVWPRVKRAIQFLLERDGNEDGVIEGAQPNTLDAAWYGRIAWLVSLYLAALRAGEEMALEMGEPEFAERLRTVRERGRRTLEAELWNGEFFFQEEDPEHRDAIGAVGGCYIDQVIGQGWAFQLGLGRTQDAEKTRAALQALFRHNFFPDLGPFLAEHPSGRTYQLPGEAGMVMCSWPRGGRPEQSEHWQAMYFEECMTGFEHQVAAHMLWEGLVDEGLTVERAIHERYAAARRNPWNEIECSDHYARAMASHGVFLAACGFEHHGPRGHLGFAPRLSPDRFRAPFVAATGWGTFAQTRAEDEQAAELHLRRGTLRLETLALVLPPGAVPRGARARVGSREAPVEVLTDPSGRTDPTGERVLLRWARPLRLAAGDTLRVDVVL